MFLGMLFSFSTTRLTESWGVGRGPGLGGEREGGGCDIYIFQISEKKKREEGRKVESLKDVAKYIRPPGSL